MDRLAEFAPVTDAMVPRVDGHEIDAVDLLGGEHAAGGREH